MTEDQTTLALAAAFLAGALLASAYWWALLRWQRKFHSEQLRHLFNDMREGAMGDPIHGEEK